MLGSLRESFTKTIDKLSGKGRITESDVADAAREIKLALLAADVHYGVVRDFVDAVAEKAVGERLLRSITPAQQFAKIVHDELARVLGSEPALFYFESGSPTVVMLAGLQGSGKTTTAARFALWCRKIGRRPYLIPADVHRPAAIEQLRILAAEAGVDCWDADGKERADKLVKRAMAHAGRIGYDTVIIDTAGRLHIDERMMEELRDIAKRARPDRILYVADSMTGQDAVNSAAAFDRELAITGIVLTKLDGDSRGGAALSIRAVTGKPIIFAGVGERLCDMEPFHPARMAGRILDKGDVVSLVEKVASEIGREEAVDIERAVRRGRFTLEDFLGQMRMIKRLGPLEGLLGMLPGIGGAMKGIETGGIETALARKQAIVLSMTPVERRDHRILNGSRRRRIARGAGVAVSEVNRFLKEFETMEKMMKRLTGGRMAKGLLKSLT